MPTYGDYANRDQGQNQPFLNTHHAHHPAMIGASIPRRSNANARRGRRVNPLLVCLILLLIVLVVFFGVWLLSAPAAASGLSAGRNPGQNDAAGARHGRRRHGNRVSDDEDVSVDDDDDTGAASTPSSTPASTPPSAVAADIIEDGDDDDDTMIPNNQVFDFIVIGSGSGGTIVAERLSRNPTVKVLFIDKGSNETRTSVRANQAFAVNDEEFGKQYLVNTVQRQTILGSGEISIAEANYIGGMEQFNGRQNVWGDKVTYDYFASGLGLSEWSYDKVLPFQKTLENFLGNTTDPSRRGVGGDLNTARYAESVGVAPGIDDIISTMFAQTLGYDFVVDHNVQDAYANKVSPGQTWKADEYDFFADTDEEKAASRLTVIGFVSPLTERPLRETHYNRKMIREGAEQRPNLLVLKNSFGHRLLRKPGSTSGDIEFDRVEYITDGKCRLARARKEIIIAAGTIGTPQILERSGIGNHQYLSTNVGGSKNIDFTINLPGVGENFHDKLSWTLPAQLILAPNLLIGLTLEAPFNTTAQVASGQIIGTTSAYFKSSIQNELSVDNPLGADAEIQCSSILVSANTGINFTSQAFIPVPGFSVIINVCIPQLCSHDNRGFVHIREFDGFSKADIKHPAYTDLDYVVKSSTINAQFELAQATQAVLNGNYIGLGVFSFPFGDFGVNPLLAQILGGQVNYAFLDNNTFAQFANGGFLRVSEIFHYGGTAKMGLSSDPAAVVDQRLKVHGSKNVRVCDNSVFPFPFENHGSAMTKLAGARCADFIARDNGLQHPLPPSTAQSSFFTRRHPIATSQEDASARFQERLSQLGELDGIPELDSQTIEAIRSSLENELSREALRELVSRLGV